MVLGYMILGYLDPGSGSLLLQAVLGGLAGMGVAFKAWRARFARGAKTAAPEGGGESEESATLTTEP